MPLQISHSIYRVKRYGDQKRQYGETNVTSDTSASLSQGELGYNEGMSPSQKWEGVWDSNSKWLEYMWGRDARWHNSRGKQGLDH